MKAKTLMNVLNRAISPVEWIDKNGSLSLRPFVPDDWTVKSMWVTPDGWLHVRVSGDFNTL